MARVYLIENHPLVADISRILLEADGHNVKTAQNMQEAEQLLSDVAVSAFPDVVFSDANLQEGETSGHDGRKILNLVGNAALQLGVEVDFVSISNEPVTEIYDLPSLRAEFPNLRIHSTDKNPDAIAELASRLAA